MIHDAELFTVGPDEVVVTFRTDDDARSTTLVGDTRSSRPGRYHSARVDRPRAGDRVRAARSTAPSRRRCCPAEVTTLAQPAGALLATFATVNDVHFGEVECGRLGTPEELGPIFTRRARRRRRIPR